MHFLIISTTLPEEGGLYKNIDFEYAFTLAPTKKKKNKKRKKRLIKKIPPHNSFFFFRASSHVMLELHW
jgi:hypothetical protein